MTSGSVARRENKEKVSLEILTMKKALKSHLHVNQITSFTLHLKTQVKLKNLQRNTNLLKFLLNLR
jgi:sulfate adenylyltransferase subunit 1 (EFTu-like GTPase family)